MQHRFPQNFSDAAELRESRRQCRVTRHSGEKVASIANASAGRTGACGRCLPLLASQRPRCPGGGSVSAGARSRCIGFPRNRSQCIVARRARPAGVATQPSSSDSPRVDYIAGVTVRRASDPDCLEPKVPPRYTNGACPDFPKWCVSRFSPPDFPARTAREDAKQIYCCLERDRPSSRASSALVISAFNPGAVPWMSASSSGFGWAWEWMSA